MVVADATVDAFRCEGVRIGGIWGEGKVNLFVIKVRLKAQDGQMNGENASRRANWTGRRLVGGIGRCVESCSKLRRGLKPEIYGLTAFTCRTTNGFHGHDYIYDLILIIPTT